MWKTNILGSPTVMIFGEEDCRRLLKEEGRLVEVIWPDVTAELVGAGPPHSSHSACGTATMLFALRAILPECQ